MVVLSYIFGYIVCGHTVTMCLYIWYYSFTSQASFSMFMAVLAFHNITLKSHTHELIFSKLTLHAKFKKANYPLISQQNKLYKPAQKNRKGQYVCEWCRDTTCYYAILKCYAFEQNF